MTYPFVFYSFIAVTFYTDIFVAGDSTRDCEEKYIHLTGDCRPTCKSKGTGFHRSFSCNHYCFCRDDRQRGKHRTCPDGMVFNHLIEHCDYPENYKCPERPLLPVNYKCPKPEGFFEYPGCCIFFVTCDHDTPSYSVCPSKYHFSVETEKCEPIPIAGCNDRETTTPEPQPKCDFKCPDDGVFPHPSDCSKFCHCTHGIPFENQCDPSFHFNPNTKRCDLPAKDDCVTTPEPVYPRCNFECPGDGSFPHPTDCSKYCDCISGISNERECDPGLHFSQTKKICTDPYTAGCAEPTPEPDRPKCNIECPGNGLFPHPSDCTKFCHCNHNIPYENTCPPTLHFNPRTKTCDYPIVAGCKTTETTTARVNDCGFVCPGAGLFPHPDFCEYYCECINDIPVPHQRECAQEMHFNLKTKLCDDPFKAHCDVTFVECPEKSGVFPHPMRDDWYIYCESGYAKIYHCETGSVFNLEFKICVPPDYEKKSKTK